MIEDNPTGIPERVRDTLAETDNVAVDLLHPSEVSLDSLQSACVVVIDHRLQYWEARDVQSTPSLKPQNGVALASVLRSNLAPTSIGKDMTALCLLTGHPGDLAGDSEFERRPQVLARSKDLEWVFDKEDPDRIASQLVELCKCVSFVRETSGWDAQDTLSAVLAGEEHHEISESYLESAERCRPPLVQIDEWDVPMTLVRWLLHGVLPYPGFLIDELHLSAALRVTPDSLSACLSDGSDFAGMLEECRYKGYLSEFNGPRWWRTAISDLVWKLSKEGQASAKEIEEATKTLSKGALEPSPYDEPVVCIDEHLLPANVYPLTETLRLQPDDWPSYASTPRATQSSIRNSKRLRLLVIDDDLELLDDGVE